MTRIEPNPTTYCVTFDRVGRHGGRGGSPAPAPVEIAAADLADLAAGVLKAARPYLASREVEVELDESGRGSIICGFRVGGTFTFEVLAADRAAAGGEDRG